MIDIQGWNNYVLIMVGYLNFSQMYMGIENFFLGIILARSLIQGP